MVRTVFSMFSVAFKGTLRDRVLQGILATAVIFLALPSLSSLSMRQVTELSITLSLSLISFILLLISVFLGGTSLWKDIDRRYTFSVMGMPVSRTAYLIGRFAGIAAFVALISFLLGMISLAVIRYTSGIYPPNRPIVWPNVMLAILYDALKYILLVSFAFLFSTVSTSFFLPVFGTISVFLAGNATQQVYDFVTSQSGKDFPLYVKKAAIFFYYVLPNFSAFDLKVNAVYGVALNPQGLLLTAGYFAIYLAAVLTLAAIILSRREFQ